MLRSSPPLYPLELTRPEHGELAAQSCGRSRRCTPNAKKKFRTQGERFGLVSIKYNRGWHYSQNRPGVGYHLAPAAECWADCSFGASRLFYSAGVWSTHPIADPLGMHYSGYGNTESIYAFLRGHHAPRGKYRRMDVALYLQGPMQHHHVVVCIARRRRAHLALVVEGLRVRPREISLLYRLRPDGRLQASGARMRLRLGGDLWRSATRGP